MTFTKINDNTVQCAIAVKEIVKMGYVMQELYTNKEAAANFMRSIMEKGAEAGFQLNSNLQEIQVVLLPNEQLNLIFTEVDPGRQVNQMIENAIEVYEAVESIGKERMEAVLNMSGKEKLLAFQEIMETYKGMADAILQNKQVKEQDKNLIRPDVQDIDKKKFMLEFTDLSHLEKWCKSITIKIPSHLYKDSNQYYLLADFTGMEQEKIDGFMVQALDFATKIEKNDLHIAFVEEHAKYMIENEAIEMLKKI
ncbi:MAG: adaptor protein MecA [Lachnotalea sp.]